MKDIKVGQKVWVEWQGTICEGVVVRELQVDYTNCHCYDVEFVKNYMKETHIFTNAAIKVDQHEVAKHALRRAKEWASVAEEFCY